VKKKPVTEKGRNRNKTVTSGWQNLRVSNPFAVGGKFIKIVAGVLSSEIFWKGRMMKRHNLDRVFVFGLLCLVFTAGGCEIHMFEYGTPRARYERTVEPAGPMPDGMLLSAQSNDGWITIKGSDVTECSVRATIIAGADSDEKAARIADESRVELERVGPTLAVKLHRPALRTNEGVDIQFTATVPRTCNLELTTDDGAIDFTPPPDFSADAEIITDDGSIDTELPVQVVGNVGKNGIRGVIGTGEGSLYIKTEDGSARIR
jgi:hypothetical protein